MARNHNGKEPQRQGIGAVQDRIPYTVPTIPENLAAYDQSPIAFDFAFP